MLFVQISFYSEITFPKLYTFSHSVKRPFLIFNILHLSICSKFQCFPKPILCSLNILDLSSVKTYKLYEHFTFYTGFNTFDTFQCFLELAFLEFFLVLSFSHPFAPVSYFLFCTILFNLALFCYVWFRLLWFALFFAGLL